MRIQVNTDSNVGHSVDLSEEVSGILQQKLKKYEKHITTLEIYLSDTNSDKGGSNDKKCSIEARIAGLSPLAASDQAGTLKEAIAGATKKIDAVIKHALDRRQDVHRTAAR